MTQCPEPARRTKTDEFAYGAAPETRTSPAAVTGTSKIDVPNTRPVSVHFNRRSAEPSESTTVTVSTLASSPIDTGARVPDGLRRTGAAF